MINDLNIRSRISALYLLKLTFFPKGSLTVRFEQTLTHLSYINEMLIIKPNV